MTRVFLSGVLIHGPSALTLDCTVREMSESGVRIRLTTPDKLWAPLALLIIKTAVAFQAEAVWQKGHDAELTVMSTLNIVEPQSQLEGIIRRLWLARTAQ